MPFDWLFWAWLAAKGKAAAAGGWIADKAGGAIFGGVVVGWRDKIKKFFKKADAKQADDLKSLIAENATLKAETEELDDEIAYQEKLKAYYVALANHYEDRLKARGEKVDRPLPPQRERIIALRGRRKKAKKESDSDKDVSDKKKK